MHEVNEWLRRGISEFALRLKLRGIFGERRADPRADVNDRGGILHPRQCRAHKSIRREEQMVALMRAARLTEIMHGTSFPEIPAKPQAAPANDFRTPAQTRH